MKKVRNKLALLLCVATAFGTCAFTGCDENVSRESFAITYNLNYEGGKTRAVSVQAGAKPISWRASREGYNLSGWYTDPMGNEKFDFTKGIKADQTVYAIWTEKPGMASITFDFGYAGAKNKTIAIEKTDYISTKYIPKTSRFGMSLTGWFTDKECTNEWNFTTDTVSDTMTLYAGYEYTSNIPRDAEGNVAYDNTTISVWNAAGNTLKEERLEELVSRFNEQYSGKIIVESSTDLKSQQDTFLRIQQTPEVLRTSGTYYSVAGIYSFADIDFKDSDWYEGASRECKLDDILLQVPVVAVVPYLVYNKTLLTKYNGEKALPKNYTELSTLLKAAYNGEIGKNTSFRSILTDSNWMFKEAPSQVAFMQNGAPYYELVEDNKVNTWKEDLTKASAITALKNTYDLFGNSGKNHGSYNASNPADIVNKVSNGTALMGLINWSGQEDIIANNSNLGIMPLSGLFTDHTDENSKSIPVHTIGFGFCNLATNIVSDPVKVCATALFADYLSKNAYMFSEFGYTPLHKAATANEEYINSDNSITKLTKAAGDPENFRTLYGMIDLKNIVNTLAAETYIVPFLQSDGSGAAEVIETLRTQIAGMLY